MIRIFFAYLILLTFSGCSGYRFKEISNPFKNYGISSVSVPMFVNQSILPRINVPLTKEIFAILLSYPGLKVHAGENKSADALLLGVVSSGGRRKEVFKTTGRIFTEGLVQESLGERQPFYLPIQTEYGANLQLVLVRKPTKSLVNLIRGKMGKHLVKNSKIIFNETLSLNKSFTRRLYDNLSVDKGGVVNFSQNLGNFEKSMSELAKNAAIQFDQEVLDAF